MGGCLSRRLSMHSRYRVSTQLQHDHKVVAFGLSSAQDPRRRACPRIDQDDDVASQSQSSCHVSILMSTKTCRLNEQESATNALCEVSRAVLGKHKLQSEWTCIIDWRLIHRTTMSVLACHVKSQSPARLLPSVRDGTDATKISL